MIKLPKKYSYKWIYILIALFLLTFVSMFIVNMILDTNVGIENTSGFALLSLSISLAIGLGGLLGAKVYFKTAFLFNILGLIYMFVITIFRSAEGWTDLVSLISYLLILSIGIILGVIVQLAVILIVRYKNNKTQLEIKEHMET